MGPKSTMTGVLIKGGYLDTGRMPHVHEAGHLQPRREAWNNLSSQSSELEPTLPTP